MRRLIAVLLSHRDEFRGRFDLGDSKTHLARSIQRTFHPQTIALLTWTHFVSILRPDRLLIKRFENNKKNPENSFKLRNSAAWSMASEKFMSSRATRGEIVNRFCMMRERKIQRSKLLIDLLKQRGARILWRIVEIGLRRSIKSSGTLQPESKSIGSVDFWSCPVSHLIEIMLISVGKYLSTGEGFYGQTVFSMSKMLGGVDVTSLDEAIDFNWIKASQMAWLRVSDFVFARRKQLPRRKLCEK